jgi:hypothetical protein
VEDDHSDSESDDDDWLADAWKNCTVMESAQKPQKSIMVAVVNMHLEEEGCGTERGDAGSVHGDSAQLCSVVAGGEYNETLDISIASHRAHGE